MRSLPFAFVAAALTSSAVAGPFPQTSLFAIGYREATLADFEGTPGYTVRRAAPDGLLALSADFNGDGQLDEVRILLNEARGRAYVAAAIETPEKLDTYVLKIVSLAEAADTALRLAPATGSSGRPGVAIYSLANREEEQLYFDGEEFRPLN